MVCYNSLLADGIGIDLIATSTYTIVFIHQSSPARCNYMQISVAFHVESRNKP
jgi:hypothetical protein